MIEEADASIFDWIMTPLSSLENFGNFGDGLGGTLGIIIGLFTVFFVYKTYQAQKREIKRLTDESRNTEIQHTLITWIFPKIEDQIKMLDTTKINKHCEANALEEVQFNTDTWTKSNSSSLELLVIFYDLAIKEIEKSGEKDEIKYRIILNHIISSNHVDRIRSMLTKHTQ